MFLRRNDSREYDLTATTTMEMRSNVFEKISATVHKVQVSIQDVTIDVG
jgi:hypothetical protein